MKVLIEKGGTTLALIRLILLILVFLSWSTLSTNAQPVVSTNVEDLAEVNLGSTPLFVVTGIHSISARERAEIVHRRLEEILYDSKMNDITTSTSKRVDSTPVIYLGKQVVIEVTAADAATYGVSQEQLGRRWASKIKARVLQLKPIYEKANHHHNLKVLSEHRILLLLLQLAALLLGALAFGELATRLGQPAVLGQIFAGIALGQSGLGLFFPELSELLFPPEQVQSYLLEVISWLGVVFLLMLAGMETDFALMRLQSRRLIFTVTGLIVPFGVGFAVSYLVPDTLLIAPEKRLVFALFLATIFSVSSVPVIARILMEMKLLRRNIGQLIISTSLCHDTIGCLLLALVAALAGSESTSRPFFIIPLGTLLFIAFILLTRRWIFDLLRWVHDTFRSDESLLCTVVVLLLLSAAFTHFIGVHVVLGAFIIGAVLAQSPLFGEKAAAPLKAVALGVFAPIFFAAAGLHVNLKVLMDIELLMITVVLLIAICSGKAVGNWIGAKLGGCSNWEALGLAFGANAPGAVGIIIAILGFSMGIITLKLLSIIIITSVVSTCITPPLIRWSLSKVAITPEEQVRIDRQKRKSVFNVARVLVPTRGGSQSILSFGIASSLGHHHNLEMTAFHVAKNGEEKLSDDLFSAAEFYSSDSLTLVRKKLKAVSAVNAIIDEAKLGYDLIILGATESPSENSLFGEFVDQVVRQSPCSLLIVRKGRGIGNWPPRNIMVSTKGVKHSGQMVEIGVLMASQFNAHLTVVNVLKQTVGGAFWLSSAYQAELEFAEEVVANANSLASNNGVDCSSIVRSSIDVAQGIIEASEFEHADIVLISVTSRESQKLHLGNVIPKVWKKVNCAAAVLVLK